MWLLVLALTLWLINTKWKSDEYNNIGNLVLIIAVNPSPHTRESDKGYPFFSHAIVSIGLLRSQS